MTVAHNKTRQPRTSGRDDEKMVARHTHKLALVPFLVEEVVRIKDVRRVQPRNHGEGNDEDNPPERILQIADTSRPLRTRRPGKHLTVSHRRDVQGWHSRCGGLPLSFFAPFTTGKMAPISALRTLRNLLARVRCIQRQAPQHRRSSDVLHTGADAGQTSSTGAGATCFAARALLLRTLPTCA